MLRLVLCLCLRCARTCSIMAERRRVFCCRMRSYKWAWGAAALIYSKTRCILFFACRKLGTFIVFIIILCVRSGQVRAAYSSTGSPGTPFAWSLRVTGMPFRFQNSVQIVGSAPTSDGSVSPGCFESSSFQVMVVVLSSVDWALLSDWQRCFLPLVFLKSLGGVRRISDRVGVF